MTVFQLRSKLSKYSGIFCKLLNITLSKSSFFPSLLSKSMLNGPCKPCIAEIYKKISNGHSSSPWIFLRTKNVSISGRKSLKIIVILTKSSLTSYFKPKIISKTWKKLILIDSEYSKKAVLTMIGDISVDQACSVECALATII